VALTAGQLGLPAEIRACLFDLDGVLTKTAALHAVAWKTIFDSFLRERDGGSFVPFDSVGDYDEYVDGKQRNDGARAFLESRGIRLTDLEVADLADRKHELALALIRDRGVEPYEGSVRYVDAVRNAGLRRAVVSASENCGAVLAAAGIDDLFELRVDGLVAEREHLRGKPAPDTFLAAATLLSVQPAEAAVFEDALAGVAAGRAGGFRIVVGVDRVGQADALREHGADIVVADLAELLRV
jgi:beta-phosphoglucomutase family hydrolase